MSGQNTNTNNWFWVAGGRVGGWVGGWVGGRMRACVGGAAHIGLEAVFLVGLEVGEVVAFKVFFTLLCVCVCVCVCTPVKKARQRPTDGM